MPSNAPAWWKDARTLQYLMAGAWKEVSGGFFADLRKAFEDRDPKRAQAILDKAKTLGPALREAIGKKSYAVLAVAEKKALRSWQKQVKKTTKASKYQEFLAKRIDDQIGAFLEAHPGRILEPEIQAQIDYLKESDLTTTVDISNLLDRLEQTASQDSYFEKLSTVQTSRLWHADGVQLARENGIRRGVVTGPIDGKTCPVCRRLVGMEFDIEDMAGYIDESIDLTDVDEYIAAWRFPRLADVDNISRQELAAKKFFPPFHPNCRHSVTLLSR